MTRAEVLARVLDLVGDDVAQIVEHEIDELMARHDHDYELPAGEPDPAAGNVGEEAVSELLASVLDSVMQHRADLVALVERLAVDSGVALPYVAPEYLPTPGDPTPPVFPHWWVVEADGPDRAKVRPRDFDLDGVPEVLTTLGRRGSAYNC